MTDLSTLTDTELTRRLMLAMGFTPCPGAKGICAPLYGEPLCRYEALLDPRDQRHAHQLNIRSLDALKSGPEKMLRDAGWKIVDLMEASLGGNWEVTWHHERHGFVFAEALTEERARAEAVCQGLEVSK